MKIISLLFFFLAINLSIEAQKIITHIDIKSKKELIKERDSLQAIFNPVFDTIKVDAEAKDIVSDFFSDLYHGYVLAACFLEGDSLIAKTIKINNYDISHFMDISKEISQINKTLKLLDPEYNNLKNLDSECKYYKHNYFPALKRWLKLKSGEKIFVIGNSDISSYLMDDKHKDLEIYFGYYDPYHLKEDYIEYNLNSCCLYLKKKRKHEYFFVDMNGSSPEFDKLKFDKIVLNESFDFKDIKKLRSLTDKNTVIFVDKSFKKIIKKRTEYFEPTREEFETLLVSQGLIIDKTRKFKTEMELISSEDDPVREYFYGVRYKLRFKI